jgi:pyridinium-3,5-biscarboxylic acid mononucleotide sulfurtransferase
MTPQPTTPNASASPDARAKLAKLEEILRGYGQLIVAYSGGVDSAFLAVVAHRVLGNGALAVTAESESLAPEELAEARELARRFGFAHEVVRTEELKDPRYQANTQDRCYFCKTALMNRVAVFAKERGARVALGANVDDLGDHRPGERAAREHGAVFPLREAGLTKLEIRALSAELGLPTADKPAAACLASRIPFGDPVTAEKLRQVAQAEAFLHQAGFGECRVRHHGPVARLEIPVARLSDVLAARETLVPGLKKCGFVYVALDLQGLRSGSLHEAVKPAKT